MLNVITQGSGTLKKYIFIRVPESKGGSPPDSCLAEGNGQRVNKDFAVEEPGLSENSSRSADSSVSAAAPNQSEMLREALRARL